MPIQVKPPDSCSHSVPQLWFIPVNGLFKYTSDVVTQVNRPDLGSVFQNCLQYPCCMSVSLSAAIYVQEPQVCPMETSNSNKTALIQVLFRCRFYFGTIPTICRFESVPTGGIRNPTFVSPHHIVSQIELPPAVINK